MKKRILKKGDENYNNIEVSPENIKEEIDNGINIRQKSKCDEIRYEKFEGNDEEKEQESDDDDDDDDDEEEEEEDDDDDGDDDDGEDNHSDEGGDKNVDEIIENFENNLDILLADKKKNVWYYCVSIYVYFRLKI
jgi:hypothetical protein